MDALYGQVTPSHVIRKSRSSKIRPLKLYHLFSIQITLTSILNLLKYLMCQRLGIFRSQLFVLNIFWQPLLPSSFENVFTLNQDWHTYENAKSMWHCPRDTVNKKDLLFLIRFFAPAFWNLIPLEFRNSNNLITLKRAVKGHYRDTA